MKELRQVYMEQCKKNIKRHFAMVVTAIAMLSTLDIVSGFFSKKILK